MAYAVVWCPNGGMPAAGRLELAPSAIRLAGGAGCELAYAEIAAVHVERRATHRLAGRPTLVIETDAGQSIRIASLDRAGTLHELEERLQHARLTGVL